MEFIENQPWRFTSRNEYQECQKPDTRCNWLADGDDVFVQFKLSPCGGPLLCDSDFSSEGGDAVSNGNFAGSAAGWTLGGTWSYNALEYVDVVGAGSTSISQTIAETITSGHCYIVVFTVLNYVSGGLTPSLANVLGVKVTADGAYRQIIIPGNINDVLSFIPDAGSELSLDKIELYDMGPCWCPDNANIFASGENSMCHVPGMDTILTQVGVTPPIVNGQRYKVQITIAGRSAGSVHYIVGATAVSVDFIGNGSFTDYVFADGDDNFQIFFSSDFDGCITNVIVELMPTDIDFGVVNIDETAVQELNGFDQYVEDRVIIKFNTTDFAFAHGCYKLVVADPCLGDFFYSNCFNWQTSWPGSRQVIAIDREGTDPANRYSYGLLWFATTFYLVQRVRLHFRKSKWETQFSGDRYSTGKRFKSYLEKSKTWELAVEELNETQHDCLQLQFGCKSTSIDGVEYVSLDEEYAPLWDDLGNLSAAAVKINIKRRQDVIFSDNCNR